MAKVFEHNINYIKSECKGRFPTTLMHYLRDPDLSKDKELQETLSFLSSGYEYKIQHIHFDDEGEQENCFEKCPIKKECSFYKPLQEGCVYTGVLQFSITKLSS